MTTGTNLDVQAVMRRWAAGVLGVLENASSVEARRAYFRKARGSAFVPSRSLQHALRILDGEPLSAERNEEWLLEEEGRLRTEVESFAVEFFTLSVTQRRERFEALLSRCPGASPLGARMQSLKAGLEVEIQSSPFGGSFQDQLAEQLLHSFPLPPLALATSRQAFLRKIEEPSAAAHRKLWEKAARYVLAEWPAIAALDPELVQQVVRLRRRLKRQSRRHRRSLRNRPAAAAGNGKKKPWALLWIWCLVGGGILRGLLGLIPSNNSSMPRAPSFNYSIPPGGKGLPRLDELRGRILNNLKNGTKSLPLLLNLPTIDELLDPATFDVEIIHVTGSRFLQFTPRPGSIIAGKGPQATHGQPMLIEEATLILRGVSDEQMSVLFSRAAKAKPSDSTLKAPPEEMGPPQSSSGNQTRP
jgi:hypothetical protein